MLLTNLLGSLAKAYDAVYRSQNSKGVGGAGGGAIVKKEDFYGLRDFYALVRDLNAMISANAGVLLILAILLSVSKAIIFNLDTIIVTNSNNPS